MNRPCCASDERLHLFVWHGLPLVVGPALVDGGDIRTGITDADRDQFIQPVCGVVVLR